MSDFSHIHDKYIQLISGLNNFLKFNLHYSRGFSSQFSSQPVFLTILELTMLSRIRDLLKSLNIKFQTNAEENTDLNCHMATRANFILSQCSNNFTINYLPRSNSKLHHISKYPDDVDDTFSAFYALYLYNPALISTIHIASLLASLDSVRVSDKPFRFNTWYIKSIKNDYNIENNSIEGTATTNNSDRWNSLDFIAESAIVAFFSHQQIEQNNLKANIIESLLQFTNRPLNHPKSIYDYDITEPKVKNHKPQLDSSDPAEITSLDPSSDFYHDYPLALYLCTRMQLNTEEAQLIFGHAFTTLQKDPDYLSPTNNPNPLNPNRIQKNNFIYASIFNVLRQLSENYAKQHESNLNPHTNFIADTEYYFDSYIESLCLDFYLDSHINLKDDEHSGHDALIPKSAYPLFIDSYENDYPIYQKSNYIDLLIQFESVLGFIDWKSQLLDKNKKADSKSKKDPNYLNSELLSSALSDNRYIEYLKSICSNFLHPHESIDDSLMQDLIKSKDFYICRDICLSKPITNPENEHIEEIDQYLKIHALGLLTYHIYDKILDKEYALTYLPLFSTLQRELSRKIISVNEITQKISDREKDSLLETYQNSLAETDNFYSSDNAPNLIDHYKKSIGISIIPIYLYKTYSYQLQNFFKYYILIRQILDDLKDYEKDQKNNQEVTSLTSKPIIKSSTMQYFKAPNSQIDIDKIFSTLNSFVEEIHIIILQIDKSKDPELVKILTEYIKQLDNKTNKCRLEFSVLRELNISFH